jgi:hypothetical protein
LPESPNAQQSPKQLWVVIECAPDVDRNELGELTIKLRERLLADIPDIEDVQPVSDSSSAYLGKAGDALLPGVLIVVGLLGRALLREICATTRTWIEHRPVMRATLKDETGRELEVSGPPSDVERELDRFYERLDRQQGGGREN